jgi:glutaredoxin-related protein
MVPESCKIKVLTPEEQVKKTLSENKLVILINGTVDAPKDDESKSLIEAIKKLTSEFTAVDCSVNKPFPTVPYVFLNGKPACAEDGLS